MPTPEEQRLPTFRRTQDAQREQIAPGWTPAFAGERMGQHLSHSPYPVSREGGSPPPGCASGTTGRRWGPACAGDRWGRARWGIGTPSAV